jgi:DNA invertase Pin-like site-specific DNA recombinase
MIYGYARVSTDGQDEQGQVEQLTAAGAVKVFREKESGANSDRPQLKRAIAVLDKDDVLMVTAIDRMARDARDFLNITHEISAARAKFKSLSEPWANSDNPQSNFVKTIMAATAELGRHIILANTAAGRKRAIARGVKMGRKPKLSPAQRQEALNMLAAGRPHSEVRALFNISKQTLWRLKK